MREENIRCQLIATAHAKDVSNEHKVLSQAQS